jgi:hypothetical protein
MPRQSDVPTQAREAYQARLDVLKDDLRDG